MSGASRMIRFLTLAFCMLLAACGGTTPTHFYTLSSLMAAPGEAMPAAAAKNLTVGVGPVTLPEYLNRPQIVTRDGSNRMILADFDSWIEPMDGLFTRTLAEDLSLLLGTDDVVQLPERRPVQLDYRVAVDVMRFDVDSSGNAVLDARWQLSRDDDERLLRAARSTVVEPVKPGDQAAGAQGLSRALGAMSRQIAAAIAADRAGAGSRRTRTSGAPGETNG
jgi:uncharacterized lipoprotein YmbA